MPKCAAYWRAKDAGKECGVPKPGKMSRILQDAYQYGVVPDLVVLQQMVSKGFGEDEYSAFCIALKWASERISSEVKKND